MTRVTIFYRSLILCDDKSEKIPDVTLFLRDDESDNIPYVTLFLCDKSDDIQEVTVPL